VPEPRMPLPWEKAIVHKVLAWEDRRASGVLRLLAKDH
jgi:hypothetical protein